MSNETYLQHHGVKGQKWGVRRYQNPDGTLTDRGKKKKAKEYQKEINRLETNSNDILQQLWVLNETDATNKKKIERNKLNVEVAKKFIEENKIVNMKMKDLGKRYKQSRKEVDAFVNKMYNDPDVLYRVSDVSNTGTSFKNWNNLRKEMDTKYGNNRYRVFNPGSSYEVYSDRYSVKANTKKNQKKKEYTDDYYKDRNGQQLKKVTTYYY